MTSGLQVGDRVLCYHGPKLYEAKILQLQTSGQTKKYLVHYKGWKSKWDEWVENDRIVPYNDSGLDLQKNLAALHPGVEDQSGEVLESPPSAPSESSQQSQEAPPANKAEIPTIFKLGKNFKFFSSFDWNQVIKRSKILAAPVDFSVADFLQSFAKVENNQETTLFIENFIKYLDVAIGKTLLYRQERLHYMSLDRSRNASNLFGPMVLIRFFAQLNNILQEYHSNPEIASFASYFSKLSEYLIEYLRTLNVDSLYMETSEHYQSIFTLN